MKRSFTLRAGLLIALFCSSQTRPFAQTLPNTNFSIANIGSGWNEPVGIAFSKTGNRLFVWQKSGQVYVLTQSSGNFTQQTVPVLDISPEVGDWRDHGLLGFALDPNFDTNGLIYLLYVVDRHYLIYFGTGSYNAATNDYFSATIGRITRYKTVTNGSGQLVVDPASRTILVGESKTTGIPILYESHGIGSLAFAADGTLLASAGDAASYNSTDNGSLSETYYAQALTDGIIRANENVGAFRAQMLNSMNGKILRIDPTNGNGVSSNPYYSSAAPRSPKSRVWALGFRNPFRFSIRPNTGSTNPATGDIGEIYVGDVGYNTYEELNILTAAGMNCGWPIFEGALSQGSYASTITYNKDEVNPLFGTGSCTQQYFSFQNLLRQANSTNTHTVYNPCKNTTAITGGNDNRFYHRLPALDWKHGEDSTRIGVFSGTNLSVQQIGSAASGITGTPFRGNASVGGCWYDGNMFPAAYKNTYFQADYGGTWLKNFNVQFTDKVQGVTDFSSGFGAIVSVAENPADGSLFCVDLGTNTVKRIKYGGNQPPIVKITSDKKYGPAPLAVSFTGSGSSDPDNNNPITYSWNFGDGTALVTTANPSHTFTTSNGNPKKFVVKLTVKDALGLASVDSIIISANNTPPHVSITSPINNSFYKLGPDTSYLLRATVTDAEQVNGQLTYQWQTILRHNNHQHPEAIDTFRNTSSVISRIGCNGDTYYFLVLLTVTDNAGLSTMDSSKIYPQCSGALAQTIVSFSGVNRDKINMLNWVTSSEINLETFEIQKSLDGANFFSIGTVDAQRAPGLGYYNYNDQDVVSGYCYYRLKMIDVSGQLQYSIIIPIFSGDLPDHKLLLSPNPVHSSFVLDSYFDQPGPVLIRITDMNGRLIKIVSKDAVIGSNSFTIDGLYNIPAGVYIVELIQNGERRTTKMVKG